MRRGEEGRQIMNELTSEHGGARYTLIATLAQDLREQVFIYTGEGPAKMAVRGGGVNRQDDCSRR